jgi:hypothetical protein
MLLIAPNGATVDACEDQVQKLLDAGFAKPKPAEEPKPAPKRTSRKTKE